MKKQTNKEYYEIYSSKSGKVIGVLPFGEDYAKTICNDLNVNNNITKDKFLYRPSNKEAYEKHKKDLNDKIMAQTDHLFQ